MATTTAHIQCPLHGNDVAYSSEYPVINADFWIEFTRDGESSTISWRVYNNTWTGSRSGRYGFEFYSLISINDDDPSFDDMYYIIKKDTTSMTYDWWENEVTLERPSGTFTSTASKATIYIWVRSDCNSGEDHHPCYPTEYYLAGTRKVNLPELAISITYNLNGGSGDFPTQVWDSGWGIAINSNTPTYPLNINYNIDGAASREVVNRTFINWLGSDGNTYNPGAFYNTRQNLTLTAQWGSAAFTPTAIPDKYYTLTYNYGGGSGSPALSNLARAKLGYATSASGTTYPYQPGTTYNITSGLDLWAKWGDATVAVANLPTPTKTGYTFDNWYKDSSFTQPITTDYSISGNTTIYAKWISLPMYQMTPSDGWGSIDPYVWQCVEEGGNKVWKQVAHVYKLNNQGSWTDISEP